MLAGHSIVCFAPNRWHDIWRNRQHIFSRLARQNRILFVEPDRPTVQDWRRGRLGAGDVRRPSIAHVQDGLYLYRAPAWLPASGKPPWQQLAHTLQRWHLKTSARRLGLHRPILWLYRPEQRAWRGQFGEMLTLYHVTDEYSAYAHWTDAQRARLLADERQLLAEADLVVVTTPELHTAKAPLARRLALVPNGVDAAAFIAARTVRLEPEPLRTLPHPRLGYVGYISSRLDLALLAAILQARPHWSLALVGSVWDKGCEADMAALRALPNVAFVPPVPGPAVPDYVAAFDAGLIPYRLNEETAHISPLKLYEYLAAGLPVVSADIPAARAVGGLAHIARGAEGWIEAIEAALAQKDNALRIAERQAFATANDWLARVEALSTAIAQALAAKRELR